MFEKCIVLNDYTEIPHSDQSYFISSDGEVVKDRLGRAVEVTLDDDGESVVWIKAWRNFDFYKLSQIKVIIFKGIKLPVEIWDDINVFHIDGDKDNLKPANLGYRFPEEGLEVKGHVGFYYIPMSTTKAISEDGTLLNLKTGKKLKAWIAGNGYGSFSNLLDTGHRNNLGRHRALALVFKPYPNNVDKLDVNHINGVPGDDWLDNLEWVTRRRNIEHMHQMGLSPQSKLVLCKNLKTGVITEYFSLTEAERVLGLTKDTVRRRLKVGDQRLYIDCLIFKLDDDTPWRSLSDFELNAVRHKTFKMVLVKNVFTGEVVTLDSIAAAGDLTKVDRRTIAYKLKVGNLKPMYGWIFKRGGDETPWPEFNEVELRCFRRNPVDPPSHIKVVNIHTLEETLYADRLEAAEALNVSRYAISDSVSKNCVINKTFKAYNLT